jgi:predicted GIY-YIG superfamily endonuclease
MPYFYVYILQSESDAGCFYVGLTDNLRARLKKHNKGDAPHTSKFRPWKIKTAIAFTDRERASQFEGYLKTASGRAFTKKRL